MARATPNPALWLPTTADEIRARGWDAPDVVFVTGDAYVDHPSFAMAVLSRVLESHGIRVAILPQPDWRSKEPFMALGRPRLFFAVSAGNMDSMINHYTAGKKVRNSDAYSPGGRIGMRPDRATLAYCQRSREAFPGVPVIAATFSRSALGSVGYRAARRAPTASPGRRAAPIFPTRRDPLSCARFSPSPRSTRSAPIPRSWASSNGSMGPQWRRVEAMFVASCRRAVPILRRRRTRTISTFAARSSSGRRGFP